MLIGLIGLLFGLLGMQLAMTKGAFLALIPLVIFLGCCVWKFFRSFGFLAFLAMSASLSILIVGAIRRGFWSAGSIGDRFELIRQSLSVWSDDWLLGVGFSAQGILDANPLTMVLIGIRIILSRNLLLGEAVLPTLLGSLLLLLD